MSKTYKSHKKILVMLALIVSFTTFWPFIGVCLEDKKLLSFNSSEPARRRNQYFLFNGAYHF